MTLRELLPLIVTVLVTIIGTLGTVYARRVTRHQDDANVSKLEAEAEERRVAARAGEVEIARALLAEVQNQLDRRTAEYERRLHDLEARERQYRRALAEQAEWVRGALVALRAVDGSYPAPPQLRPPGL